jgi:hypothetical protein
MLIEIIPKDTSAELDITPTPRILQVLENLAVEPWRCLAEFIDNSLDDFRKNEKDNGEVNIFCENGKLIISDNGSGMSIQQLENALRAGYSNKSKVDELGLFGIGFNVACANLGKKANVITKRKEDKHWTSVVIDIIELTKKNTFKIQPKNVSITDYGTSGTIIIIDLKNELAANFERSRYLDTLAKNLGKAYTYILRDSVPGLTGPLSGNARKVAIKIAGKTVLPHIPCIWSEERNVTYKNQVVQAVEKFRRDLPDSAVCNNCGHWSENQSIKECMNCQSVDLVISHRQVWGWIGVQRYMDGIDFGIDFIRNGRTILFQDKEIFTFTNPNTGQAMKDYPVEWPADKGRIVGEVHCDHVKVDFIKKTFDVNDPYWAGAISIVRGDSSLQPKRSDIKNTSPLSKIFNAFRINEPGSAYLIPGNGIKAIHDASKNWAVKFHELDPEYISDKHWFDAVESHDRIVKQTKSNDKDTNSSSPENLTLDPFSKIQEIDSPPPIVVVKKESINDLMGRLEAGGSMRMDLSKSYQLNNLNKMYNLNVWETISEIAVDGKSRGVWAHPVKGTQINVYINGDSDVFLKYRRSKTDLALIEAALLIKGLSNSNIAITEIYYELLKQLPDEEYSEKILRSRVNELRVRLLERLSLLVSSKPNIFTDALSVKSLTMAEENAVSLFPKIKWSDVKKSGNLALCLPLFCVAELIEKIPEELFDGKLFTQHYATTHAQKARERTQGYTAKAINDLNDIQIANSHLNAYELSLCGISIAFINDVLVHD